MVNLMNPATIPSSLVPRTELAPGVVLRGLNSARDFTGMAAAYNRWAAAGGIERALTAHELATQYEHLENSDLARDVAVVEGLEGVIGYSRCEWREEPVSGLRVYTHRIVLPPEWCGDSIEAALLARTEARLRQVASEHPASIQKYFQVMIAETQTATVDLLMRHGYQPARYDYTMLRPTLDDIPELPLPDGIEVRPAIAADYRRIWEADNEAFRDHWGYTPMGDQDYERWRSEATFDPSLWRVAWEGDQVVGMVLAFVNATENAEYNRLRGYTEDICVRRPWRRRGIARALLARSLRGLRARGMTEAALGVDSENTSGALRLYESLGFRPINRFFLMRRPLDPADGAPFPADSQG